MKHVPLAAGVQEQLKTIAREAPGSVEELQLETRVMCSPGLEVEVEFAAPLALGRSVGDDHLDRVIVDLVGNAAPAVEEVRRSARRAGSGSRTRMGRVWPHILARSGSRLAHSRRLTSGTTTRSDQGTAPANERLRASAVWLHARARRITGRSARAIPCVAICWN